MSKLDELKLNSIPSNLRLLIETLVQTTLEQKRKEIEGTITENVEETLSKVIDDKVAEQLRGEKGEAGKDADHQAIVKDVLVRVPKFFPKDGKDGLRGLDGKDGKPGKNGIGHIGPRGIPGRDGKDGKDGRLIKPDEVVDKVIESEKNLPISKIDGLEQELATAKQARGKRGGGGGGMGNVTHEQKSVSSSTTTVSTNSRIAGNGFALFCFYNGQMVARGVDYTVSAADQKTITLLFTPQNSTVFDIIYFRT